MKLKSMFEDTVTGNIAAMPARLGIGSIRRRMLPQGYKYVDNNGKCVEYDDDGNAVDLNEIAGYRRRVSREDALFILQKYNVDAKDLLPVGGVVVDLPTGSYIYTQVNPLTQDVDYFLVMQDKMVKTSDFDNWQGGNDKGKDIESRSKDTSKPTYSKRDKGVVRESAGFIKRISYQDAVKVLQHHNMNTKLLYASGVTVINLPCGSIIMIEQDRMNSGQNTYYLKIGSSLPDWLDNVKIDLGGKEGPQPHTMTRAFEGVDWKKISGTLGKKMDRAYPDYYFKYLKENKVGVGHKRIGKEDMKFYNDRGKLIFEHGRKHVVGNMPKTNEQTVKAIINYLTKSHIL